MTDLATSAALDAGTVVRQSERTASRVISGQAVVVVIDAQRLHTLNEVGTRVWELAQGSTLRTIAETICDEYEVGLDEAQQDVMVFARALLAEGMIEIVHPS